MDLDPTRIQVDEHPPNIVDDCLLNGAFRQLRKRHPLTSPRSPLRTISIAVCISSTPVSSGRSPTIHRASSSSATVSRAASSCPRSGGSRSGQKTRASSSRVRTALFPTSPNLPVTHHSMKRGDERARDSDRRAAGTHAGKALSHDGKLTLDLACPGGDPNAAPVDGELPRMSSPPTDTDNGDVGP